MTQRLLETVRDAWLVTVSDDPPRVDYIRQIADRLPELYALHPELGGLRGTPARVFGISHPSLGDLLERAAGLEARLAPPISVRIHGDFNTNNILYDEGLDRIHLIDVHRSGPGDYLQDIGVFLVSSLRNPIQDTRVVTEFARLNGIVEEFARQFAGLVGDGRFDARLELSMARSLITSSRLVGDARFARDLFLRGVRSRERAVELGA